MTDICRECGDAYTAITSAVESLHCPACRSRGTRFEPHMPHRIHQSGAVPASFPCHCEDFRRLQAELDEARLASSSGRGIPPSLLSGVTGETSASDREWEAMKARFMEAVGATRYERMRDLGHSSECAHGMIRGHGCRCSLTGGEP